MKLLAFTKYGNRGASSRLRFGQFMPWLVDRGWDITVSPLFNDEYLRILYESGRRPPARVVRAVSRRVAEALTVRRYDAVWIEKELLPWVPEWIEAPLRSRCARLIVDLDDAIFHSYDTNRLRIVRYALGTKIDHLMASADLVTVCNDYLQIRARSAGAKRVEVVPTVLDPRRYSTPVGFESDRWTVGWIGTPQTLPYLIDTYDVLRRLARSSPLSLLVVGADAPGIEGVDVVSRPWTLDTEAELVSMMSVGIMPLPDGPWEQGKCGYKLIQYMAAGLPVVASSTGANRSIVANGRTGFLATSPEEWHAALVALRDDRSLGQRFGALGRKIVESDYNVATTAPMLADLLESVM